MLADYLKFMTSSFCREWLAGPEGARRKGVSPVYRRGNKIMQPVEKPKNRSLYRRLAPISIETSKPSFLSELKQMNAAAKVEKEAVSPIDPEIVKQCFAKRK